MKKYYKVPRNKFWLFSILAIVLFMVIGAPLLFGARIQMTKSVRNVVDTIVRQDHDTWGEMVHPNCDKEIKDLDTVRAPLEKLKIKKTDEVGHINVYYYKDVATTEERNSIIRASFRVGDERVDIYLHNVKNDDGEGIMSLSINPR